MYSAATSISMSIFCLITAALRISNEERIFSRVLGYFIEIWGVVIIFFIPILLSDVIISRDSSVLPAPSSMPGMRCE